MTLNPHELAWIMNRLGDPPKGYISDIRPGGNLTAQDLLTMRQKVRAMYEDAIRMALKHGIEE